MNTNEMLKEVMRLEREGKVQEAETLNTKLEVALSIEVKQLKDISLNTAFKLNKIKNQAERVR